MPSGEQFLHHKDATLHTSKHVEHEQTRKRMAKKETSPKPADKISDWLKVIEQTHTGHRADPRILERIKEYYRKTYVIKPKDIPESTFLLEQRIAREEGHGIIEITDEFREQKIKQIIADQQATLDRWVDYLSSQDAEDAHYPMWARYWAFTSILKMGKFEKVEIGEGTDKKESGRFVTRTKDTVASFPTLNARALGKTIEAIEKKLERKQQPKQDRKSMENISVKLNDPDFQKLLSTEDFSRLYAQFLIELPEYSTQGLQETRGKWVTYKKGSDPKLLVDSLEGYPLEWCTAQIDTARTQLRGGDFHVYYSLNEAGEAVIPRLAIRMQDNKIAESPKGIAHNQHLDPYINKVLEKKLDDFPDKEQFKKRSADMKRLTAIEKKTQSNQQLTQEDLIFLYEIDSSIEGFGYQKDPRIKELRGARNPEEDAPIIFGCAPEEIAWGHHELTQNSKVHIGPLFKDIFSSYPNLEHIYTSFPEGRVREMPALEVSVENFSTGKEFIEEIEANGMKTHKNMLTEGETREGKTFDQLREERLNELKKLGKSETINTVRLTVADLFNDHRHHATQEIWDKAVELGLELCPAETGPLLRLAYKDQPYGEYLRIAMEQISGSDGVPDVFLLYHRDGGLWLLERWAGPGGGWDPGDEFVFRLRR